MAILGGEPVRYAGRFELKLSVLNIVLSGLGVQLTHSDPHSQDLAVEENFYRASLGPWRVGGWDWMRIPRCHGWRCVPIEDVGGERKIKESSCRRRGHSGFRHKSGDLSVAAKNLE